MESKYYTPDIKEFHIGFEYEIKDPLKRDWDKEFECKEDFLGRVIPCDSTKYKVIDFGWKPKVLGEYNEIIYKHDYEIPYNELQHVEKNGILEPTLLNYRVKYLDQKDIESLGWKFDEDETSCLAFVKNIWDLWYYERKQLLTIESEETGIVFKGYIKNKSELKKLLKQLGINE